MSRIVNTRITAIWLFLVVATLVSWEAVEGVAWLHDPRQAGVLVMAIAFTKARYVLLDFMELRHAILPMRLFAEAWCILVGIAIVGAFWSSVFAP